MMVTLSPLPCGCVQSTGILRNGPPIVGVHVYCDAHRPSPSPSLCADFNAAASRALGCCRTRRQREAWGVVLGLVVLLALTCAAGALARKFAFASA